MKKDHSYDLVHFAVPFMRMLRTKRVESQIDIQCVYYLVLSVVYYVFEKQIHCMLTKNGNLTLALEKLAIFAFTIKSLCVLKKHITEISF